jgi:hypothetical protein
MSFQDDIVRPLNDRPENEVAKSLSEYSDEHSDPSLPPPSHEHYDPSLPPPMAAPSAAATQWRVAKSLLKLREEINAKYPGRNKASDGTIGDLAHCPGSSDHCPNIVDVGVGVVTAMDITHDPVHGLDAGAVADALCASRDPRIKYIISNARIASSYPSDGQPPFVWRTYTGANPHRAHFHISVLGQKTGPGGYDTESDWGAI